METFCENKGHLIWSQPGHLDGENNLFKVSGKQHVSFEVILVHNAMKSFQQKVPPILLGAFEDIFD
jgi:hypothetical protein